MTDTSDLERLLSEAVAVFETAHLAVAETHFHLEAALSALRAGRTDEARRYFDAAVETQARFVSPPKLDS